MQKFVDMKREVPRNGETLLTEAVPMTPKPEEYPYGLRVRLDEKDLAKLGLSQDHFKKDDIVDMRIMGKVVAVSCSDSEYGSTCTVEIQGQSIAVENESEEELGGSVLYDYDQDEE